MTRKKTTTGTMGSKRKTDTKKDKADKAKAKDQAAPKVAEQKAHEVIPEVAIGLLATHASLPDRGAILTEFAADYREVMARALEAASAPPEPEPEPVIEERPRLAQRRRKPTIDTPARYATRPQPSLTSVEGSDTGEELSGEVAFAAAVVESSEDVPSLDLPPAFEGAAGAEELACEIAPDELADAAPVAVRPTSEVEPISPFGAVPEADDLFALLKGDAPVNTIEDDLDFGHETSQDQSSPFLMAPGTATGDEGATRMMSAFEDEGSLLGTPISQEALEAEIPTGEVEAEPAELIAPTDATTMIQAIADDEDEASAPTAEPAPGPTTRKSRKSSRKRKG